MLVFFIHGVNTQNYKYADSLIKNIKKNVNVHLDFYSGFWGNLFNNKKYQLTGYIEKDILRACEQHQEYKKYHYDIYRYKERRSELINNFLTDFLIYQNYERGKEIRRVICEQIIQFLENHSDQTQIHFVAHSLGSFVLWDLLFSNVLPQEDPSHKLREKLKNINLESITTLGCPLLFLKQMLDIDFSVICHTLRQKNQNKFFPKQLRWVNVIHSSDLLSYPLKAAIENEISSEVLFFDQYVWQDANGTEKTLRNLGQSDLAMVIAAQDAHSSYFCDNLDGFITARIIGYNIVGDLQNLTERCVSPK